MVGKAGARVGATVGTGVGVFVGAGAIVGEAVKSSTQNVRVSMPLNEAPSKTFTVSRRPR